MLVFNLATDEEDPVLGFATAWVRALAERVDAVDVITMKAGRADLPGNVKVYSVGKERGFSEPRRAINFYGRLAGLLASYRYDACFAHMMPLFALLGAPLLKARRVPITLWYTHEGKSWRLRLALHIVDRVVTATPGSFQLASSKVHVTGHGIDTDWFVPGHRSPSDRFRLLTIGRVAPVKRLEVLLDAVALLARNERRSDLEVRIIGPIDPWCQGYAADLRRRVKNLGLDGIVELTGLRRGAEVIEEYHNADVFISLCAEGFDKVVLEAMSCGLPVITTNTEFASALRRAGADGPVPVNDPGAVAAVLERLAAASSSERRALGLALREQVVRDHSLDHLADLLVGQILWADRARAR